MQESALETTMKMLRSVRMSSQMKVNRSFGDFFADRMVQAFSRPTLLDAVEYLAKSVDSSVESVNTARLAAFMQVACGPEAPGVLAWIRQHPRIASMISAMKDADMEPALDAVGPLPVQAGGAASPILSAPLTYDIGIKVTCLSPLAHGSDTKAGNATLFRRMSALGPDGTISSLPYYAGNALRGQVRDLLADHLLYILGLTPRRDKPPVKLWFFHILYAGGVLEEKQTKAMDVFVKSLGAHGSIRSDGIRSLRDTLPAISLLGAALGNKIISGRCCFGDLLPQCREWGLGDSPAAELMEWIFLTRRDDHEGRSDDDQHRGMIATTETLRAGTVLQGGVDVDTHASDMELSALACGLELWQKRGRLGAESRRGLGKVAVEFTGLPPSDLYTEYLVAQRENIRQYLEAMGALGAPGLAVQNEMACRAEAFVAAQ